MKKWQIITLSVFIFFAAIATWLVTSYVSAYNYSNKSEVGITTQRQNNKNILGQYTIKISEMVQVPTMMKNDLKEVIREAIGGRYGSDGSKATWQWIKEHNPTVDPDLYRNIQQAMEAGRNKFENAQTLLLSRCQDYEEQQGRLVRGLFIRTAGYPKIDYKMLCKPIVAEGTEETFSSGVDKGVKIL